MQYRYAPPIINSFEILDNPLFNHYFPLFFRNGPRSKILEGIIKSLKDGEFKVDIRYWSPQFGDRDKYIPFQELLVFSIGNFKVFLKLPFLPLFILSILIFLIWKKELMEEKKLRCFFEESWFLLLILIFFLRVNL